MFYADVEGHPDDPPLARALEELKFFSQPGSLRSSASIRRNAFRIDLQGRDRIDGLVRTATLADVDGIARVHVQAWRESYRRPDAAGRARRPLGRTARRTMARHARRARIRRPSSTSPCRTARFAASDRPARSRWTGLSTDSEISALYLLDAIKRRGIGRSDLPRACSAELAAQGFTSTGLWVLTRECAGPPLLRGAWVAAAARRGSNAAVNMCSTRSPISGTTLAPSR